MHYVRMSTTVMAMQSCHCDAKTNHLAGAELVLVRPRWGVMAARLFTTDGKEIDLTWPNPNRRLPREVTMAEVFGEH